MTKAGVGDGGTTSLNPWQRTASRELLAEKRRTSTRSAGAESSVLYAVNCPTIGR